MGDKSTCGDFGGLTKKGEPCGQPGDGRCYRHPEGQQNQHSRAKYDPERVASLIMSCNGNLSEVSRMIGCNRSTLYDYLERYEEVAEARDDAREGFVDLAESALRKRVKEGDTQAIRFVLRCWGKGRGWSEKQEVDITTKGDKVSGPVILIPSNSRVHGVEGDDE